MKILNFGSLNLDYTYQVDHFVRPGETESSVSRTLNVGGKGLNQSIAIAKAGSIVYHAGAVGKEDGDLLLNTLKASHVNTDHIRVLDDVASGNAFIQVDPHGENCIVLYGGANRSMTKDFIDEVLSDFSRGDWIVLQNEINELAYLIHKAHELQMTIVLNPSPMNEVIRTLPLQEVSFLIVNKEEAEELSEHADHPLMELASRYPDTKIVMTLGSAGVDYWNGKEVLHHGCYNVKAVDTTGAGDTFTGYFISCLMQGYSEADVLRLASTASAIAVTRNGASASIPEIYEVLSSHLILK